MGKQHFCLRYNIIRILTTSKEQFVCLCWGMNIDWGEAEFNIHSSALKIRTVHEAVVDIPCYILIDWLIN